MGASGYNPFIDLIETNWKKNNRFKEMESMSTQYPAEVFRWMLTSLQTVPIFYGVIPVKELYKVFESGKEKHPAVCV